MTNAFSQRPEDYYASAAAHFKDFSDFAKSQSIVAFDRITSLLNKHYFSELCIFKNDDAFPWCFNWCYFF